MSRKFAELIDGLEFFKDFSFRELETLGGYFSHRDVAQGEIVFNEGDPGRNLLILLDGKMSIYKSGESGRYLLSYEGRGRIVGEMALLDHELRSASCIAETPCELLSIDQTGLDRMALEHPSLAYLFMYSLARLLSKRLRRTSGILAEHLVG